MIYWKHAFFTKLFGHIVVSISIPVCAQTQNTVAYEGLVDGIKLLTEAKFSKNDLKRFDIFSESPPISLSTAASSVNLALRRNMQFRGFVVESVKCVRLFDSAYWVVTAVRRAKSSDPKNRETVVFVISMGGKLFGPSM